MTSDNINFNEMFRSRYSWFSKLIYNINEITSERCYILLGLSHAQSSSKQKEKEKKIYSISKKYAKSC